MFIKKNIEKWKRYQYEKTADPDELARQFTEIVDDLGYARTFYPQSRVTAYLNGLASRIYLDIYRNKKEDSSRIVRFWKTELPLMIRNYQREVFLAGLLFLLFATIAAFSASHDESFVRGILGDGYVEMTEDNIARGDPFGVYRDENATLMFVRILVNNIRVAVLTFVAGLLPAVGVGWFLMINGAMVGAFQYYFFAKGLGWASVLVIWIHGTLEISSIILAGAAGLVMGNSILFPGTHSRKAALRRGAKDGLKILIGIIPLLILAALLEGFVTRYVSMPRLASISILVLSLAFIIFYFGYYPFRVAPRQRPGHNQ